eukprot:TRINITY_DN4212_c0_g1_i1.p1 TRINITY_DN4212_c0_g1~~TRINITY_DN4212_c0_g1_i1.p1  ORF type:complete len:471 (+),score=50.42 TRINITY_DN4212_c0_g1_i1:239-1651(+)
MGLLGLRAVLVLTVAVAFTALFDGAEALARVNLYPNYNPKDSCPDLNHAREKACLTGKCSANLLQGLYKAPTNCDLISVSGNGVAQPSSAFYAAFGTVLDLPDSNPVTSATATTLDGTYHNETAQPSSTKILALQKDAAPACCRACKLYNGQSDAPALGFNCNFYQHYAFGGGVGLCFLYSGKGRPVCGNTTGTAITLNTIGAKCATHVVNDPHLSGAHGTPYDFSGIPDQSFTLVTDERINVNMKMTGYLDSRLEGAPLIKDGKALRTWIRELGIQWLEADGVTAHGLHLVARGGRETERKRGFMGLMEVDGKVLDQLKVGESVKLAGGAVLTLKAIEKIGSLDSDYYTLVIDNIVDMDIRLRPANKLLWTSEEAEVHFSVGFNSLERTSNIHGVLGQTYREDHADRAFEFSKISAMLHHNVHADGPEGEGFLDGKVADYRTSSVMVADCKFNVFNKKTTKQAIKMVTN